jgi:hypothetical protein
MVGADHGPVVQFAHVADVHDLHLSVADAGLHLVDEAMAQNPLVMGMKVSLGCGV